MASAIFISYASKDRKIAMSICDALENRGFSCWISNRDVLPGQNYQEAISRAIRSAKVMVLVFTANANNSDEIKKELSLASQSRLVVIPLRVEDVVPNDAFSYEFATRQWIDFFDGWEAAFKTLTNQITAILSPDPAKSAFDSAGAFAEVPVRTSAGRQNAWANPQLGASAGSIFQLRFWLLALGAFAVVVLAAMLIWRWMTPVETPQASTTSGSFPHRKPGLWEQRTTIVGSHSPMIISELCLDASTEAALINSAVKSSKTQCPVFQNQTIGTATVSDTTCNVGGAVVTAHTVGTFPSDVAFHLKITSHSVPAHGVPVDTTILEDGSWIGDCPSDMKPGDIISAIGQRANLQHR